MKRTIASNYLCGPRNIEVSVDNKRVYVVHNMYKRSSALRIDNNCLLYRFPNVLQYRLIDITDDSVVDMHT
jgi:hypothetical protein